MLLLLKILDANADLLFSLKKQQLIELIKQNKCEEAIQFAQTKVAPKCKGNTQKEAQLQKELESVMALLMFEDVNKAPMKELLESNSRKQLASEVNKAILLSHGHQADLKLGFYWQLLQWSQDQLKKQLLPNGKRLEFPVMTDPMQEELDYQMDD